MFDEEPLKPITLRILNDPHVRDALLPDCRQRDAARLLLSVNEQAHSVARSWNGWWSLADRKLLAQLKAMTATA